jgi:hypothetical protein
MAMIILELYRIFSSVLYSFFFSWILKPFFIWLFLVIPILLSFLTILRFFFYTFCRPSFWVSISRVVLNCNSCLCHRQRWGHSCCWHFGFLQAEDYLFFLEACIGQWVRGSFWNTIRCYLRIPLVIWRFFFLLS